MEALAPPSVVFHLSCLAAWRASSLEVRRFLKWMPASCRAVRSLPSVDSSVARAPAKVDSGPLVQAACTQIMHHTEENSVKTLLSTQYCTRLRYDLHGPR